MPNYHSLSPVLSYYRSPIQHKGFANPANPLLANTDEIIQIAAYRLNDPRLLKCARRLRASPEEIRESALFYIKTAFFNSESDHFRVLGLDSSATKKDVKTHFRLLSRLFHPDRSLSEGDWDDAYAVRINQSYTALSKLTAEQFKENSSKRNAPSHPFGNDLRPTPANQRPYRSHNSFRYEQVAATASLGRGGRKKSAALLFVASGFCAILILAFWVLEPRLDDAAELAGELVLQPDIADSTLSSDMPYLSAYLGSESRNPAGFLSEPEVLQDLPGDATQDSVASHDPLANDVLDSGKVFSSTKPDRPSEIDSTDKPAPTVNDRRGQLAIADLAKDRADSVRDPTSSTIQTPITVTKPAPEPQAPLEPSAKPAPKANIPANSPRPDRSANHKSQGPAAAKPAPHKTPSKAAANTEKRPSKRSQRSVSVKKTRSAVKNPKRAAPAKPPLLSMERQAETLLQRYAKAYNGGDIGSIMRLFSHDVVDQNLSTGVNLDATGMRRTYSRFFSLSSNRQYSVRIKNWTKNADTIQVKGRFNIRYVSLKSNQNKNFSGDITFVMRKIENRLLISKLIHR